MLQLLLVIISAILLLVPDDECLHIFGSAEYKQLQELANVQPSESKLLPFLYKQQSSQSLDDLLTSSAFYNSASPNLSKPPKSSFFSKGQESSLYGKEFNLKSTQKSPSSKPQLSDLTVPSDTPFEYQNAGKVEASSNTASFFKAKSATLGPQISWPSYKSTLPNQSKPPKSSIFTKGQESSLYLKKSDSKTPHLLSSLNSNDISDVEVLSSKPPLSDLVIPLDTSFEYQKSGALSNMVPLCRLIVCELKQQLLKEIQSSADNIRDQKFLVRELSTNYENPDQRLPSRARTKKIKIKEKSDEPSQLAENWYGSQKNEESLAKKKKPTSKKLKIFSTLKQEMKYKETLKKKVKKLKKAKKTKIFTEGIEPLKNSWRNRENTSSRKSKTLRCYNTRKQDDNGSQTVCVTYPKSWGAAVPYPYYYPVYYPAYYYYPYYYYGRR